MTTLTHHGRWAVRQLIDGQWVGATVNAGYSNAALTCVADQRDQLRLSDRHGGHRVYCMALDVDETATALKHGHLEPSALTPGRHVYLLPENGGAVVGLLVDGVFLVEPHADA